MQIDEKLLAQDTSWMRKATNEELSKFIRLIEPLYGTEQYKRLKKDFDAEVERRSNQYYDAFERDFYR